MGTDSGILGAASAHPNSNSKKKQSIDTRTLRSSETLFAISKPSWSAAFE